MEKSRGHMGFVGNNEYYDYKGQVYRAPIHNAFDCNEGVRIGRWESSREHFDHYHSIRDGELVPVVRIVNGRQVHHFA